MQEADKTVKQNLIYIDELSDVKAVMYTKNSATELGSQSEESSLSFILKTVKYNLVPTVKQGSLISVLYSQNCFLSAVQVVNQGDPVSVPDTKPTAIQPGSCSSTEEFYICHVI